MNISKSVNEYRQIGLLIKQNVLVVKVAMTSEKFSNAACQEICQLNSLGDAKRQKGFI